MVTCGIDWAQDHHDVALVDADAAASSGPDPAGHRDVQLWSGRVTNGENPTPREVSEEYATTIHAARTAVRRYKSGIIPKLSGLDNERWATSYSATRLPYPLPDGVLRATVTWFIGLVVCCVPRWLASRVPRSACLGAVPERVG